MQPGLYESFLTVVFVVAEEVAEPRGEIAGPATAESRESGHRLGTGAIGGSFAKVLQSGRRSGSSPRSSVDRDEQAVRRVVEEFRRHRMGARIDEGQTVPESRLEEAEAEVDGDVVFAGEVELEPLFDDAVGHESSSGTRKFFGDCRVLTS